MLVAALYITDAYALPERGKCIRTLRHEFLRDIAFEAGVQNRLHYTRVIQLLRVINLVSSRHAAGVVVIEVLRVLLDGFESHRLP